MTRGNASFTKWLPAALLGAGLLWVCQFCWALTGAAPVATYRPTIDASPSNSDLVQDSTGTLYIANDRGVMTFDGEHWDLTPLPNGDAVYALGYDGVGRIYVGAHSQIGYVERDRFGQLRYTDLTESFAPLLAGEDFGAVPTLRVTPYGVFFIAVNHALLFNPLTGERRVWRHEGRFGAMAVTRDSVFLQFRGEGLRRYEGGIWQPVANTTALRNLAFDMAPLSEGGILVMSADGHWREFVDGVVRERVMPTGFPNSATFNSMRPLADGSLALPASDGRLWLLDTRHNRAASMNIAEGSINGVWPSMFGGLLAVTDLAVHHVDWPGAWTTLDSRNGIHGQVHRIVRWNHRWLALTGTGVLQTRDLESANFERMPWTDNDAWDLLPLDEHVALLADFYQLMRVDSRGAHALGDADLYPRLLTRSRFDPTIIYVGTEYGLAVLTQSGSDVSLLMDHGARAMNVASLVELSANELLVGTRRHGVHRLVLSADHRHIERDEALADEAGITYGKIRNATLSIVPQTGIIASTDTGLFVWKRTHFQRDALDGIGAFEDHLPVLTFMGQDQQEQWAFGDARIYHRAPQGQWASAEAGNLVSGYVEALAFDGPDVVLIGCANVILRHDSSHQEAAWPAPQIRFQSVFEEDATGQQMRRFPINPSQPIELGSRANIVFQVSLADYYGLHAHEYQAHLLGHDEQVSPWQAQSDFHFRHLAAGEYTVVVLARDRLGQISRSRLISLVVQPAWFATLWFKILVLILTPLAIGLLIFAGISWRTKLLNAKKAALEVLVTDRTRALTEANLRLQELAHRDILTGLANRALFKSRLEQARDSAQRHGHRFAVLFVDLDQFKTINDSLGHEAGDRLLRDMAERLTDQLRKEDTLARWGGDEFMVLAENLSTIDDVATVAQALVEVGSAPFSLDDGHVVALSTSVGVSVYPDDSTDAADLIRNADTAMYMAKGRGGNQLCFYTAEMTDQARHRLDLVNGLRHAIDRQQLLLQYQPIVDVQSGRVVGAEALLRWQRTTSERIAPDVFIPIAESTGLIESIGAWVLRTACLRGVAWAKSDREFSLAVNVSRRQLGSSYLVAVVEEALRESGMPAGQLVLEITESSIAEINDGARSAIKALRDLGVKIAIDDFGMGHSALASLDQFKVDGLKIDRSFIRDITARSGNAQIAATIVSMGHSLGLSVIAEGVENQEQLAFLQHCQCNHFQGFLVSAAVDPNEFDDLLRLQVVSPS